MSGTTPVSLLVGGRPGPGVGLPGRETVRLVDPKDDTRGRRRRSLRASGTAGPGRRVDVTVGDEGRWGSLPLPRRVGVPLCQTPSARWSGPVGAPRSRAHTRVATPAQSVSTGSSSTPLVGPVPPPQVVRPPGSGDVHIPWMYMSRVSRRQARWVGESFVEGEGLTEPSPIPIFRPGGVLSVGESPHDSGRELGGKD